MPSLILSRASETDIDELLDPLYAAFKGNDLRTMFFGHDMPASRASAKVRIAASMKKGGQNVWLKVIEKETGKVISGSWWMVSTRVRGSSRKKNTNSAIISSDLSQLGSLGRLYRDRNGKGIDRLP